MDGTFLFRIPKLDVYLVIGIVVFFVVVEGIAGYWKGSKRKLNDWIQEVGAFAVLGVLIKPGIVLLVLSLGQEFLPERSNTLEGISLWLTLPLFVLVDDLMQYWYHRLAHETPFFWKLHRPHHQAEEMGFLVSYRNAMAYYLLMPNIWWIAVFTFLGGAYAVAIGVVLKQAVVISSHSTARYDAWIYQQQWLNPFIWLFEHIIVTPAFHHAHHGKSKADGVSDPNGNFGNMFTIWDQLFGTAIFTGKFPLSYGLPNNTEDHWSAAFLYPVVRSNIRESELSKGFRKESTIAAEPATVELIADTNYLWCQCGRSRNQPFCDGSHHGTRHKPKLFSVNRDKTVKLCNCKLTKVGPFCDNSHLQMNEG